MAELRVISRCPSCDGALTEHDVTCDMHIDGAGACGNSFGTDFIPEVDYDQEAFSEEASG